jgi:hypothetical protein
MTIRMALAIRRRPVVGFGVASCESVDQLLQWLVEMFDPVKQAEHALALEEHERTRTDPWRWYCRICGTEGEDSERLVRDMGGVLHLQICGGGRPTWCREEYGRLSHIWSYWPLRWVR